MAEADALYAKYSEELGGAGAERLVAAERLGSSGRSEAIGRLASYLGAESHSLATAAARGLAASYSPEARGPLEALLNEEDPSLRLAGAQGLGELGDPQAADALSRAIQQNDMVTRAALRSLIHLAEPPGAAAVAPASSPDSGAQKIASKQRTHAAELLCDVVLGSDAALAREAATAIAALGTDCSPARLRARLQRGGEVGGVLAGISVLWGTDRGSKTEPSIDDADRTHLATALGSLLRNGAPQMRPLAARAIGALGLSSAIRN